MNKNMFSNWIKLTSAIIFGCVCMSVLLTGCAEFKQIYREAEALHQPVWRKAELQKAPAGL